MAKYFCKGSAGEIKIETCGDIYGNSHETIVRMSGGQFGFGDCFKIGDEEMHIKIVGIWELKELIDCLMHHYYGLTTDMIEPEKLNDDEYHTAMNDQYVTHMQHITTSNMIEDKQRGNK